MGCKFIVCRKRKGLTLVEIVVVLIIIVIVTLGFGSSASKQVKRTNRDTVVNEMQILASNFSDAYYDLGNPVYDPNTQEGLNQFKNFLNILSNDYINYTFDMSTLTPTNDKRGFFVKVSEPKDAWEQEYCCWFITGDFNGRYVMISSGGDDGIVGNGGTIVPNIDCYKNNEYKDDVVLIVRPKAKV